MPRLPIRRDITIIQGDDWEWVFRLLSGGSLINTSSHSARMQIRADYDSPVIVDLTVANGRVQRGIQNRNGTQVNLWLALTHATTAAFPDWGCGKYDLILIDPSGRERTLYAGDAMLQRRVTK